jgi:hypothetical protein
VLHDTTVPLTLYQVDVHLRQQIRRVKLFNHFRTGSGVPRQRKLVNLASIQQPERDGRMMETIKKIWTWPHPDSLSHFSQCEPGLM